MTNDVLDKKLSLHSRYNPEREAQRYITAQSWNKQPKIIVCTEPGESFLAIELKALYPSTKLLALRYQNDFFKDKDALFDDVWNPNKNIKLLTWLYDHIPEHLIQQTIFLPWKPSDLVWKETSISVWSEIESFLQMQMGVLKTRIFYGNRWLSNMIKNALYANKMCSMSESDTPILLTVSGPSLEKISTTISNHCRVYTVSSAIDALHAIGITPEVCFSTDGGYWVRPYFNCIDPSTIVSFPLEAMIPIDILQKQPIALLSYNSHIENQLLECCGLRAIQAARNGTVSGTAALLALRYTTSKVVASGLDLSFFSGLPHARPHFQESLYLSEHNRVHSFPSILYEKSGRSTSLSVYASWFSSQQERFKGRFFRLEPCPHHIAEIEQISQDFFIKSNEKKLHKEILSESFFNGFDFITRKKNINVLLETYKKKINSLQRISDIEKDVKVLEIIELLCYREYLDALKGDSIDKIKEEAVKKITVLIQKVASYEL